jgi:hypothetical protein
MTLNYVVFRGVSPGVAVASLMQFSTSLDTAADERIPQPGSLGRDGANQ